MVFIQSAAAAAAAAKLLQSCPTLCDPIDGCPPGSPVPEILQAPSGEPGVSGDFWGSQEGCQGPSRPCGGRPNTKGHCHPRASSAKTSGFLPSRSSLFLEFPLSKISLPISLVLLYSCSFNT